MSQLFGTQFNIVYINNVPVITRQGKPNEKVPAGVNTVYVIPVKNWHIPPTINYTNYGWKNGNNF
ncbi:MAG TPA: hypothetical protein ENO40_04495 [Desulfurella acetivorans]|nr:hypothetical protein [Desulfurella acetivorans]